MADVGYVLLMIGFVVLAALFTIGCDKIIGPDDVAMGGEDERDDKREDKRDNEPAPELGKARQ